ncbi:MAG: peptide chain release factor N(5)-glutamine methyltransferase [Bacteroidota bacterium]
MTWPNTSRDLWQLLTDQLSATRSHDEAKTEAYWILEHFYGVGLVDTLINKPIENPEAAPLPEVLQRLAQHEPIQYVLGNAWFCGHQFRVGPGVLIPRPETEELVEWVQTTLDRPQAQVLDVGTGSGCIPISLKLRQPAWQVTGLDVSPEALAIARENGRTLSAEVQWLELDILQAAPTTSQLDALVSNPPYVRVSEMEQMQANVLDYEPSRALFVNDSAPLLFYQRLAFLGPTLLKPGGWLLVEINEALGEETAALFKERGYQQVEVKKDLQGKDRMIRAQWV